jgi:hypothetical protein
MELLLEENQLAWKNSLESPFALSDERLELGFEPLGVEGMMAHNGIFLSCTHPLVFATSEWVGIRQGIFVVRLCFLTTKLAVGINRTEASCGSFLALLLSNNNPGIMEALGFRPLF